MTKTNVNGNPVGGTCSSNRDSFLMKLVHGTLKPRVKNFEFVNSK